MGMIFLASVAARVIAVGPHDAATVEQCTQLPPPWRPRCRHANRAASCRRDAVVDAAVNFQVIEHLWDQPQ